MLPRHAVLVAETRRGTVTGAVIASHTNLAVTVVAAAVAVISTGRKRAGEVVGVPNIV
jgi:hypothetical protein